MIKLLTWLATRCISTKSGITWLNTGRYLFSVPVYRQGRMIEIVNARADTAEEAGAKACRYLSANLYVGTITRQEEPSAG